MLNTYVIEGGIGKCTAFTAIVPKLKEKSGEGIQLHFSFFSKEEEFFTMESIVKSMK